MLPRAVSSGGCTTTVECGTGACAVAMRANLRCASLTLRANGPPLCVAVRFTFCVSEVRRPRGCVRQGRATAGAMLPDGGGQNRGRMDAAAALALSAVVADGRRAVMITVQCQGTRHAHCPARGGRHAIHAGSAIIEPSAVPASSPGRSRTPRRALNLAPRALATSQWRTT